MDAFFFSTGSGEPLFIPGSGTPPLLSVDAARNDLIGLLLLSSRWKEGQYNVQIIVVEEWFNLQEEKTSDSQIEVCIHLTKSSRE
jgi:hypothetical protein